ncbi:class A beta-lactamase [Microbacterium arborescens]|uniref:class A beta-lactamase n=1 Tax=Microbacterium arborescens TaxID=33883 RepID=UPI0027D9067A|nr:class A beta-lactamase [Microbacterium arborescens]
MTRTTGKRVSAFAVWAVTAVMATAGCSAISDRGAPAQSDPTASSSPRTSSEIAAELARIEAEFAITVGATAIGENGRAISYRGEERMRYASTMKAFVAAAMLASTSTDERETTIRWTQAQVDAAGYSPVTSSRLDDGLTLDALAEAAVRKSDNTATNLVMASIAGPSGVEDFLRSLGEQTSVVTREEPELNAVVPSSDENTSTPTALATNLHTLFQGDALDQNSRETLLDWMSGNATGDALIRAAAPSAWAVADKSGGTGGVRNDIAVVTTESGERIYVAILTATKDPDATYNDEAVQHVARVLLAEF